MEIVSHQYPGVVELEIRGTLDSTWASQLSGAIEDVVRSGSHRLLINLQLVTYVSSAGIAVLVAAHRQLKSIQGTFGVSTPSTQALNILRLTGLEKLLVVDRDEVLRAAGAQRPSTEPESRLVSANGFAFEVFDLAPTGPLECRVFGRPESLARSRYSAEDCRRISFPEYTCGLGLGAFGADFDGCRERFGEVVAVAGGVAHLPGESSATPDYQLEREKFVPETQLLYGVQFTTMFSHLIRFAPGAEEPSLGLSALVDQCLAVSESDLAAIVIVAESAGLVGATLTRSPATADPPAGALFDHPQIRQWLSLTPERSYSRSVALIAGIAARQMPKDRTAEIAPFLRPINATGRLLGHFHAAVFGYRPMRKGRIELAAITSELFESEGLQTLLHLLADHRDLVGAGESRLISGACWVGAIGDVAPE